MSLFSWLRTRVKESILGGVQDALDHLQSLPPAPEPPAVLRLDGGVESDEVPEHTNGRQRQTARGR